MKLSRRYQFCASHRLHLDSLSEAENQELLGKCNNPYGHGHDYVLHVSVAGDVDPETGRLVDREELDRLVREDVLPRIDHKDMNAAVPEFANLNPTTENLAKVIGDWLCTAFRRRFGADGPRLAGLRLEETGRNTFDLSME